MNLPETHLTEHGFTVDGAGPDLLSELLTEYERQIKAIDPETWAHSRPGRSRGEILDALGGIGISAPPDEVVQWWIWSDGSRLTAPRGFRMAQIGLDDAVAYRKSDAEMSDLLLPGPNWVRLAGQGLKAAMAVDCDPSDYLPLLREVSAEFDFGGDDPSTRYVVSLCTPVTWWLTGMSNGWTRFDERLGLWVTDEADYPREWMRTDLI